MATKLEQQQPALRKNFIVGGAVVVGIAIALFVASQFLFGGDSATDDKAPASPAASAPAVGSEPSAAPSAAPSKPVENKLNPGGRDPFQARAGAPLAVKTPSVVAAGTSHTWQLLEVNGNTATFLVDGKKVSNVGLKKEIVKGYQFNSVTNAGCATVLKKPLAFVLCTGGAPFSA